MAHILHRERTCEAVVGHQLVKRRVNGEIVEVREPIYEVVKVAAYIQWLPDGHMRKAKKRAKNRVARQSRKINAQRAKAKRWGKKF